MNFLIVGPGAMGCLFAASLKKAGFKVTLLDYREDRAAEINSRGVRMEGVGGEYRVQVPAVVGKGPPDTDLVLVCVKSPKTMEAARNLETWLPDEARVMSLQNGLGNLEILAEVFGRDRVIGGVTAEGATLLGPGHVRHAGQGATEIGPEGEPGGVVEKAVSALNRAGFRTKSTDRVPELIWGKLIVNIGINALAAVTRLKNGRIPEIEGTSLIMEEAVREAVAVSEAKGVRLPYPEPLQRVKEVCRLTAANVASMLQDILGRRMTEIDFINGAIVREGKELQIPTPVNHTLTCLVRALQETYEERV